MASFPIHNKQVAKSPVSFYVAKSKKEHDMQRFDNLPREEQVLDLCRRLKSVSQLLEENIAEIVEGGNPGKRDLNKSVGNGIWHVEQLISRLRALTEGVIDL